MKTQKSTIKRAPRINPTTEITSYGSIAGGTAEVTRPVVTLVRADDWTGLYVGDKLVDEGHSLPAFHVIGALKDVGKFTYEEKEANQETMEEFGNLPNSLKQAVADGIIN